MNLIRTTLFILFFTFQYIGLQAQVIAYDNNHRFTCFTKCFDLKQNDSRVRGFQKSFLLTYHLSLGDAEANVNPQARFFIHSEETIIIYARVTNPETDEFAISEVTYLYDGCPMGPPPPAGIFAYTFCDEGEMGEIIDLQYYVPYVDTISGGTVFCGLDDDELTLTYHASREDADNNINPLGNMVEISGFTKFYYRYNQVSTNNVFISEFEFSLVECTLDTDNDGIPDLQEDPNGDLIYENDDTDKDGLWDYEDDDDDEDGILTINEDYNDNGDARDDDTDSSGFPDYLEANVTLSTKDQQFSSFKIYPNPTDNYLIVETPNLTSPNITILDITGKTVLKSLIIKDDNKHEIYVGHITSGVYLMVLEANSIKLIKKLVIL